MLYEVAILEMPTQNEIENGAMERLVFGPKAVIASDPQAAVISAILDEDDLVIDKTRMSVLVRPFV